MTISMYQASVPVFTRALHNLSAVLDKGAAFATSKGVAPDAVLQQRLIFDMFPLIKQVQIACDTAARSTARLAGVQARSFPDNETTLAQVKDRIANTVDYLGSFKPEQINGCEEREIIHPSRGGELRYKGLAYVTDYALPNFFFHCTTAYDILRVAGANIGKRDFLGQS